MFCKVINDPAHSDPDNVNYQGCKGWCTCDLIAQSSMNGVTKIQGGSGRTFWSTSSSRRITWTQNWWSSDTTDSAVLWWCNNSLHVPLLPTWWSRQGSNWATGMEIWMDTTRLEWLLHKWWSMKVSVRVLPGCIFGHSSVREKTSRWAQPTVNSETLSLEYVHCFLRGFLEVYYSGDCPYKFYLFHFIRLAVLTIGTSCLCRLHAHSLSLLWHFESSRYICLQGYRNGDLNGHNQTGVAVVQMMVYEGPGWG